MPHFPARIIKDKPTLSDWIDRYVSEAGVKQLFYWPAGSIHQRAALTLRCSYLKLNCSINMVSRI